VSAAEGSEPARDRDDQPPGHGPPPGYPPPGYGPPPPSWGPPLPRDEELVWAILAHLSVFVGLPILGPLVIYLVKKDDAPFARHHAAEALNFHITMAIATVVAAVLVLVLIGLVLLPAIGIFSAVMAVVATVAASNRQWYRYPLTLRLVR
jgi:uncharacterized Tic20 family protein